MAITMSDQVPMWAKLVHKSIMFFEAELRYVERRNFAEIRKEIEAAQKVVAMKQEQVIWTHL